MMDKQTPSVSHQRGTWIDPATGQSIAFMALMQEMAKKSVVILGETHDIAEIHRWQLHTAAFLYMLRPNMMMGFEMFPRRVQSVLDEWVAGTLSTEAFLAKVEWKKSWGMPSELYLPLFHFCRQNNIRMLALNCYRPLVSRVGKEGWEAIPESERDGLTPSAPPLPGYIEHLNEMTGGNMGGQAYEKPDNARFIRAMQTWDRAFACNMVYALQEIDQKNPPLVIGIIGRGHLEYGYGTPYQLADLGISNTAVLLPSLTETFNLHPVKKDADGTPRPFARAVFRLDLPEPIPERKMPTRKPDEKK